MSRLLIACTASLATLLASFVLLDWINGPKLRLPDGADIRNQDFTIAAGKGTKQQISAEDFKSYARSELGITIAPEILIEGIPIKFRVIDYIAIKRCIESGLPGKEEDCAITQIVFCAYARKIIVRTPVRKKYVKTAATVSRAC